jgi:hypothetical protein
MKENLISKLLSLKYKILELKIVNFVMILSQFYVYSTNLENK